MTINISTDKTITCPICGSTAHGLVVKGSNPATLAGCDICQHSILADLARHPNIDGEGYAYYPAERTPTDPDDYSLSTPYDAATGQADRLKLCPVCGKPCDTIIIDENGKPIGCSGCAPEAEAREDDIADYDALEMMYLYGFDACRCHTEDYNRWSIAKAREEQIVTGKAGRPLISGWDKDGQGDLYDI